MPIRHSLKKHSSPSVSSFSATDLSVFPHETRVENIFRELSVAALLFTCVVEQLVLHADEVHADDDERANGRDAEDECELDLQYTS